MQFIDLAAQRARIAARLEQAVSKVLHDGRYILGPEVTEFEKRIADYVGVKHAIGCANGTDALLIPLLAHNVGPGDAVFVPSFTFAATAEVVAPGRRNTGLRRDFARNLQPEPDPPGRCH